MKSSTLPSFWAAYRALDETIRRRAQKAYRLWAENPFHPSLHFKCINTEENVFPRGRHRATVGELQPNRLPRRESGASEGEEESPSV